MSKSIAEKLTTADVNAALRLRYTQPEWALMFEVAASTGWAGRYADAVAMNMYPSRGLALHGHEVKVSRSDWQRELKNPEKAEPISRYCDFWWIVTLPDIVKDGELPLSWGLMELHGGALRVKVKAREREDTAPLDRAFMAAMLRRAHQVDEATVTALVETGLEQRTWSLRREHEGEMRRALSEKERFEKLLAGLKEKTGLEVDDFYRTDRLAGFVRLAKQLDLANDYTGLQVAEHHAREAQRRAGEAADALEAALAGLIGVEP